MVIVEESFNYRLFPIEVTKRSRGKSPSPAQVCTEYLPTSVPRYPRVGSGGPQCA